MKTDHLLIIRFSAIGDVAMLVPVVASLAQQYPALRITVLSRPFARPLFEELAPNVGFMEADFKNEYQGMKGLNALYRRLTAKNFTHIADMHSILRSSYLRMRFKFDRYHVAHINKHRQERRMLTDANTPVVSIWGATHPYAGFMGWNQKDDNTVQVSLPCRPCSIFGNKPCRRGDYACLYNITPAMIAERVEKNL
jgi:ADP-heptose:LPS heptosyltransferase